MKNIANKLLLICIILSFPLSVKAAVYEPNWESLKKYNEAPEWFRDAKFGIYFHWGVYSVPAFDSEWYPRNMHIKDSKVYKHHVKTYGDPSVFGYHDFVQMFKAEHFDPEEWAELFKKAGARFAGPVAEHHDGFSMWASKLTPWNAKDKGPKRDITGELEKAIRKRDMKFITTFHHAFNNQYPISGHPTGYYTPAGGWPTASDDPDLRLLYGNMPREEFLKLWKGKLVEVIDNYQPDLIWFDFVLGDIAEKTRMEFLAYYFNKANEWNKEVVVTYKGDDLPREVAVEDFEKGRADHLTEYTWLTDDTLSWGSWCYTNDLKIKTTKTVIHTLIDIVSKNGQLLLNISPKADGTIPQGQREVLLEMGQWLKVNGQAIYNTRPWLTFGEGPTRMEKGGHFVGRVDYSADDIRYTRSKDGNTLYAFVLGWPGKSEILLKSVKVDQKKDSAEIAMIGYNGDLKYRINQQDQIVIELPRLSESDRPCEHAYAFQITGFKVSLHDDALFSQPNAVKLTADKATLQGSGINTEQKGDRTNIGFWDNSGDSVHWLVNIKEAGSYSVRGEFAAAVGSSDLQLCTNSQSVKFSVPKTQSWSDDTKVITIGTLDFEITGVYHLILKSAMPADWKPVNVWTIEMALRE